jgi:hypothetical protein
VTARVTLSASGTVRAALAARSVGLQVAHRDRSLWFPYRAIPTFTKLVPTSLTLSGRSRPRDFHPQACTFRYTENGVPESLLPCKFASYPLTPPDNPIFCN